MAVADLDINNAGIVVSKCMLTPARLSLAIAALTGLMVALWPLGVQGDYLNHLARTYIEGNIWFDPTLQRYYELSFRIIPNLTLDMIVPWLSHLTGIYAAGAIVVWLAFVAPPLGGVFLARTLHGRVTWTSLCGFLVMFNENMQWGFVNFSASSGLALFGFAFWIRAAPNWGRATLFALFGIFLAFSQALAFLLFGFLVLLWEIGSFQDGRRGTFLNFLQSLATKGLLSMGPGLAILLLATGSSDRLPRAGETYLLDPQKVNTFWSAAEFFNPPLAVILCVAMMAAYLIGFRRGILILDRRMHWVCAGLFFLVLLMPVRILGIWGIHFRYTAILFILLAASVHVRPFKSASLSRALVSAVCLAMVAVFANAGSMLSRADRGNREVREVLEAVPQGARILPAQSTYAPRLFAARAVDMAVIDRSAFVPDLFANTSLVGIKDPMRPLYMPQSWPLREHVLRESENLELPDAQNGYWSRRYYFGWSKHWDYILYFHAEPGDRLDLSSLCPVARTERVSLYKVGQGPCPAAQAEGVKHQDKTRPSAPNL